MSSLNRRTLRGSQRAQLSSIALHPGLKLVSAGAHLFPGALEGNSLGARQRRAVRGREEGEGLEETQEKRNENKRIGGDCGLP